MTHSYIPIPIVLRIQFYHVVSNRKLKLSICNSIFHVQTANCTIISTKISVDEHAEKKKNMMSWSFGDFVVSADSCTRYELYI